MYLMYPQNSTAISWLCEQKKIHNSVILMGDSAGACIAMATAIMMQSQNVRDFLLDKTVPIYPHLPKVESIVNIYGINDRDSLVRIPLGGRWLLKKWLLSPDLDIHSPLTPKTTATPMDFLNLAKDRNWQVNLPPTLLVTSNFDILNSSALRFYHKWKESQPLTVKTYQREFHGFLSLYWRKNTIQCYKDIMEFVSQQIPKT
jgi:acetyl esterase/lipase